MGKDVVWGAVCTHSQPPLDYIFPCVPTSFFLNDRAPTETYPLPLHDALPICLIRGLDRDLDLPPATGRQLERELDHQFLDRKSTRLNSSHLGISYAVFCL